MKLNKPKLRITFTKTLLLLCAGTMFSTIMFTDVQAQIGNVLWEENFNEFNSEQWNKDIGDGCDQNLCGWGNQELQSYEENNVYTEDIPGESGNRALVLEARRETSGSRGFTSGKVTTENKVSVHYGVIEVRVRVPNLEQGLWPAVWLLGTANITWPGKGEIDMMEMGFQQSEREHQGEPNSTVNTYVGANAFFPTEDGGVGNIAYDVDYNKPYVASTPLNDRFVTYRIYWEPTQIRYTVIDNGTEYDLYEAPFPIDPDGVTSAFTKPFYMLLNMAVGGTLPGTLDNNSVTAPMPGKMYIDYVRVSEWNGHGTVNFSDGTIAAEQGTFGVFTDETPVNNSFSFGSDAEIYVFEETLTSATGAAYEGDNVLAYTNDPAKGWFGMGVTSLYGKNMSNFVDNGRLKFNIKIPADVSFVIGVNDNFTNEANVSFPAGETTYGLVRNGEWGEVSIPIADFAGLIDFQDMTYLFRIGNDGAVPSTAFDVLIDNIVWEGGGEPDPNDCVADAITTHYSINAAAMISGTTITLTEGDNLLLSPEATEGDWSWTGPNSLSLTSREISLTDIQTNQAGTYTVTFTNGCGEQSSASYSVTVEEVIDNCDPDTLTPYYNINNSGWVNSASVTLTEGDSITFGPQPTNNSGWSWTGPNAFSATTREISLTDIQDNEEGTYTATFVNSCGAQSSINFVVTVNTVAPQPPADDNCIKTAGNGDFSAQITQDDSGSFITFIPEVTGVGDTTLILYYSTDPNAIFAGYTVQPNTAFQINANSGETVYFYYTYSLPTGGENNTLNNKMDFVVGETCTSDDSIVVRARGIIGGELIEVRADGVTLTSHILSTSYEDYTANGSGNITVHFVNDFGERDVVVDYITVNGTTLQSEDQATNTGVWQGQCGGSYSEWLHCNGYIDYGTSSAAKSGNIASKREVVKIYPNPFNEVLTIHNLEDVSTIELHDINGKLVLRSQAKQALDTKQLQAGFYILKLSLKSGEQQLFKLIKK